MNNAGFFEFAAQVQNQPVMVLDCLSDGEELFLAYKKGCELKRDAPNLFMFIRWFPVLFRSASAGYRVGLFQIGQKRLRLFQSKGLDFLFPFQFRRPDAPARVFIDQLPIYSLL